MMKIGTGHELESLVGQLSCCSKVRIAKFGLYEIEISRYWYPTPVGLLSIVCIPSAHSIASAQYDGCILSGAMEVNYFCLVDIHRDVRVLEKRAQSEVLNVNLYHPFIILCSGRK
jgi:hypothetical protein